MGSTSENGSGVGVAVPDRARGSIGFDESGDRQGVERNAVTVGKWRTRFAEKNPPDAPVVLSVDEKTQVQALDRTAPVLPMLPGTPARQTYTYVRNGISDLYAALDIASGKVITQITDQHRAIEFRAFLNLIDRSRSRSHDS